MDWFAFQIMFNTKVYGPVYPAPGEQKFMRYVVARPDAPHRSAATQRPGIYRPMRPQGWDYSAPVTAAPPRMHEISVQIRPSTMSTLVSCQSFQILVCDWSVVTNPPFSLVHSENENENSFILYSDPFAPILHISIYQ